MVVVWWWCLVEEEERKKLTSEEEKIAGTAHGRRERTTRGRFDGSRNEARYPMTCSQ